MTSRQINLKLFLMLLLLALPACSRTGENLPSTSPASALVSPEASPTSPLPPTATAVPTPIPSPTPIIPTLQVRQQTLTEDGLITIDSATIPDDGWLAIYQIVDSEPGTLLGFKELTAGLTSPITIEIDAHEASPTLLARLHMDDESNGQFGYPSADMPYELGGKEVTAIIEVDLQLPMPSIEIDDQEIAMDGLLKVNHVFALEPGWLVIHNLTDDHIGEVVGQIPVNGGENEDLAVAIRQQNASEKLMAILHEDKEIPGGFDPDMDLPVLADGIPVIDEFEIKLPPDIWAYDQPIIDGKIIIERAVSSGPGWVTVYLDDDGQQGLIIGFAALEDGLNEQVELDLVETAATPRLFLNLHEDSGIIGEFEFPTADPPIIYSGELLPPYVVHTNPGNYLATMDQRLDLENKVIVPLVVADLATWLVIYSTDEDNNPAEILGQTWLPAGINRDIVVPIESALETEHLLAILHQDGGTLEQFDFPNGVDIPMFRNLLILQSPITILPSPESNTSVP